MRTHTGGGSCPKCWRSSETGSLNRIFTQSGAEFRRRMPFWRPYSWRSRFSAMDFGAVPGRIRHDLGHVDDPSRMDGLVNPIDVVERRHVEPQVEPMWPTR